MSPKGLVWLQFPHHQIIYAKARNGKSPPTDPYDVNFMVMYKIQSTSISIKYPMNISSVLWIARTGVRFPVPEEMAAQMPTDPRIHPGAEEQAEHTRTLSTHACTVGWVFWLNTVENPPLLWLLIALQNRRNKCSMPAQSKNSAVPSGRHPAPWLSKLHIRVTFLIYLN